MAASDNSTALPSVTRRRLMMGAAAASTAWPFGASAHDDMLDRGSREDPALHLCERWRQVHVETQALCRKQQLLEAYLVRTIGFPDTQMRFANRNEVTVPSIDGLSDMGLRQDEAVRDKAVADLTAHQARWDAMDNQIGYSRMDAMIRQSEALEQALLDELLRSPATTIDGVLAKLSVILCEAKHREGPDDFPWPHIRALRNDLTRLHGLDIATIRRSEKQQNSQSR